MPDEESANSDGASALTTSAQSQVMPPVVPPQTAAPVQFNQQVNLSIQQIPSSAWDRLSPEQVVDISKTIISQLDATDKRHYEYAIEEIRRSSAGKKLALIFGSLVAIMGYGMTAYLGMHGHELIAMAIALPITTVLAMIVGRRFLD
jgi:hypothetical protein